MYIGFQIFLGILFAVTFAATVSLQGNMTDVDPTSYWNLAYWDRATSTGYGYLEFYYEDAACKAMKDVCWQAFEARKTNATAWDSLSVCSGCSQWTDNNDLASVKNFLSAPYSRQHSLFLQWLGATLALSAMALLIGATLHLLPLRPLFVAIVAMRLVVLLTAFALLSALYTAKQSLYINSADHEQHTNVTYPGITAVLSIVWALAILLTLCSLLWNPLLHVRIHDSAHQIPSVVHHNRG